MFGIERYPRAAVVGDDERPSFREIEHPHRFDPRKINVEANPAALAYARMNFVGAYPGVGTRFMNDSFTFDERSTVPVVSQFGESAVEKENPSTRGAVVVGSADPVGGPARDHDLAFRRRDERSACIGQWSGSLGNVLFQGVRG